MGKTTITQFQGDSAILSRYPSVLDFNSLVAPDVGIFDQPVRCYMINQEWAKIVLGLVSILSDRRYWRNATSEDDFEPRSIQTFLVGFACNMIQLRQSSTNECILEVSYDAGETWQTAFDYSLCQQSASMTTSDVYSTIVLPFFEHSYQDYLDNYDGTVTSIAPTLHYGDSDDQYRDEALCYALTRYVNSVCEQSINYYSEVTENPSILKSSIALGAATIGILALLASGIALPAAAIFAANAALWATAGGYTATIIGSIINLYETNSTDDYEDLDARNDVICAAYSELEGADITLAIWQSVFNGLGLSGSADVIADTCHQFAQPDMAYVVFIDDLEIGFNSAKLGLLPACVVCQYTHSWSYASTLCDYQLPTNWTVNITAGYCGDGPGTFDGLYDYGGTGNASLVFTITPDTGQIVNQIVFSAASNTVGGGTRTIRVQQGTYDQTDTLAANWNNYTYTPIETGTITVTLSMTGTSFNGVGLRSWVIDYEV